MMELTKADWQLIEFATMLRFKAARPRKDEGTASEEFNQQEARIMSYLQRKYDPELTQMLEQLRAARAARHA